MWIWILSRSWEQVVNRWRPRGETRHGWKRQEKQEALLMKARAHLSEIKDRSCRCSDLSCRKSVTFFKHAPSAFPLCGYFTKDALPSSEKADAAAQTAELQLLSAAPRAFTKNKQREVMLLYGVWRVDGDSPLWLLIYVIPPGFPLPSCSTTMPSGLSEIRLSRERLSAKAWYFQLYVL